MQTPMKYALALLAAVALLAPITSATTPHSQSITGHYTLGTAELQLIAGACRSVTNDVVSSVPSQVPPPVTSAVAGAASTACSTTDPLTASVTVDACLASSFEGTTSNCARIFSEETGQAYTIVANGVLPDPITLGLTTAKCTEKDVAGTPTPGLADPSTIDPTNPTTVTGFASAQQANINSYNPNNATAYLKDTNNLFHHGACVDGAFTKHASDLGLTACFFTAGPAVTLIGCQSTYDYKGDLSGTIPAGTSTMSVTSSLGTAAVSWWFFTGTI